MGQAHLYGRERYGKVWKGILTRCRLHCVESSDQDNADKQYYTQLSSSFINFLLQNQECYHVQPGRPYHPARRLSQNWVHTYRKRPTTPFAKSKCTGPNRVTWKVFSARIALELQSHRRWIIQLPIPVWMVWQGTAWSSQHVGTLRDENELLLRVFGQTLPMTSQMLR
jgi:hypothetical protein